MDTASSQLRAIIYTRTSKDPTQQGRSVESQQAHCQAIVERHGWHLVKVITDNDRSASRFATKDRPGYAELRSLVAGRGVDVLVATELSRATRDDADFIALRDLAAASEVLLAYGNAVYDLTRTDDRFKVGLDALLASHESNQLRDRVMRGVARGAALGRPAGRLQFGYTREYDERGAYVRQIEHPIQAEVIREAAKRVIAGEACNAIAVDLNRRGIPTPARSARGWDLTQIRRLVTRPAYAGLRVHQGKIIGPADWPAILDEADWATCCKLMADPSRRVTDRQGQLVWLLSGIMRCAECGHLARVIKNRGYRSYACWGKFCTVVSATRVQEFIVPLIRARLAAPDLADLLAGPAADETAAAKQQAAELQARLDGFYEKAALGDINPDGMAKIEKRLLPLLEDAKARARAQVDPLLVSVAGTNPAVKWDDLSLGQQRQIVGLLIDPLLVSRTVQGSRFSPGRLSQSRWAGDTRTWDELLGL